MFESLGFEELTPRAVSVWFALGLGILFGLLAERTRFCFRSAVVAGPRRRQALGIWMIALAVAVAGTQLLAISGLVSFADHRLTAAALPILAVVLGGLAFGIGMVLTRGCISRLTVLGAGGNLRGLLVLAIFAITAHATLKGVLAPLRGWISSVSLPIGDTANLATWPGGAALWTALIVLAALALVWRSGARPGTLVMAALLGALVPLGFVGTGYVLFDEFDPIAMESLSFIAPVTESLFYVVASTAIPAGFGTGLVGGVLLGALAAALIFGTFAWQSFESPAQTGRYMAGAVLMGFGGVLAGGCTIGAGLAGVPTLGLSALIALASIAAGGLAADRIVNAGARAPAEGSTTPQLQPAE